MITTLYNVQFYKLIAKLSVSKWHSSTAENHLSAPFTGINRTMTLHYTNWTVPLELTTINPNSKSIILISGDFNLRHIDWKFSNTLPSKPNTKQHQELLDIIADYSFTQLVDEPSRNDILDLLFTNYSSIIDSVQTIALIGEASLHRNKPIPRPILKANWENIESDFNLAYIKIQRKQYQTDINDLWNIFD